MFVTVDRPQPQRPCCSVFLKGQCSVHCFSYCTRRTLSESPRSWTSPAMGTPIIASSVILSSSTIDSSIALIVWANGCGGTASNSTRQRPRSFGWVRRLSTCSFGPIVVNGEVVQPSLTVRDLGVIIDPAISFADHVAGLARTCYFQIRQLRSIRRSLTFESCHALVRAMVLSRLDYCNGPLGGAPKSLLAQLSGVMRAAARLILVLPRQSHVTSEIRARLHWLDMPSRVQFKLCCLAFRCLHGSAPPYLAGDFTPVSSIEGRSQL